MVHLLEFGLLLLLLTELQLLDVLLAKFVLAKGRAPFLSFVRLIVLHLLNGYFGGS